MEFVFASNKLIHFLLKKPFCTRIYSNSVGKKTDRSLHPEPHVSVRTYRISQIASVFSVNSFQLKVRIGKEV